MDYASYNQKLNSLKTFPNLDINTIEKFGEILPGLTGLELYRINPTYFANQHNLNQTNVLDICIHGVKIGLFDFDWNMFCPVCGGISSSHHSIDQITGEKYLCSQCDKYIETDLSNYVEVSFNLSPSVKKLEYDPFKNFKSYREYYIANNFEYPKEILDYIANSMLVFKALSADESCTISFESKPNELYRLTSIDNHALVNLQMNDKVSEQSQILNVDILPTRFSPNSLRLSAGKITLAIHNRLNRKTGFTIFLKKHEIADKLFQRNPPKIRPFLTGKMLLNNQTFRDLFRMQSLPTDLKVKVSNVTILFTDLKSSTELYERKGDIPAYNIVQKHFELLKAATRDFSGAIIKTIGDAIMASFSTPTDGVNAAIDMLEKMKLLNQIKDEQEIAIKVGLHSGTALAVCANETLDYFGQTVNLAARVQGLAEGGEICMTTPVYSTQDVQKSLNLNQYSVEKVSSKLKGISIPTTVYKCKFK